MARASKSSPAAKTPAKKGAPARKASPAKGAAAKKPAKATASRGTGAGKAAAPGGKAKAAPAKARSPKATATKATATKATKATVPAKATKAPAAKTTKAAPTKAAPVKAVKAAGKRRPLDKFLESQRAALYEERASYTRQADSLRAEAEQLAEEREPGDSLFDEEGGEGDTMNVERERDLALSAQAMNAVEEIDRALERIERGTYGICEKCGEPIPKERLKALPHAALCVRCKSGGLTRR